MTIPTTFKQKLFAGYIKHRNYLTKGIGEINSFKEIIMFYMVISVWLIGNHIYIPQNILITISIVALIGFWFFGLLWDKNNLYHVESEFGNVRNYFIEEMRLMRIEVNNLREELKKYGRTKTRK
jgi:hypothetical protein